VISCVLPCLRSQEPLLCCCMSLSLLGKPGTFLAQHDAMGRAPSCSQIRGWFVLPDLMGGLRTHAFQVTIATSVPLLCCTLPPIWGGGVGKMHGTQMAFVHSCTMCTLPCPAHAAWPYRWPAHAGCCCAGAAWSLTVKAQRRICSAGMTCTTGGPSCRCRLQHWLFTCSSCRCSRSSWACSLISHLATLTAVKTYQ
jgi:hypothetical protein